jgi:hypothetical protein
MKPCPDGQGFFVFCNDGKIPSVLLLRGTLFRNNKCVIEKQNLIFRNRVF